MPTYRIEKVRKGWAITRDHGDAGTTRIGVQATRKAAMMTARFLAGWNGRVVEVRA